MGYIWVEELGGGYHPARKGEGNLRGKQKNEPLELSFGQHNAEGLCVR